MEEKERDRERENGGSVTLVRQRESCGGGRSRLADFYRIRLSSWGQIVHKGNGSWRRDWMVRQPEIFEFGLGPYL